MRHRVGLLLGLLLAAIPILVPAGPEFTILHRKMAAVVLLMATWWITEAIPIPATALLPLALFPLLGILSSAETAPSYGDHLVFLFLGGFLIASAMERWNLHRRVAIMTISIIGAGPGRLLLGFMAATAFLSMWISNTATTLMMLPIASAVVRHVAEDVADKTRGETVRREFGSILMLGIAYAASIGGVGTLIGTPPNIVMSGFITRLFPDMPEITFLQWMLVGVPFVLTSLPIAAWIVWRFGGRIPRGLIDPSAAARLVQDERAKLGPMTGPERAVAVLFALTAVLWITRRPVDVGGLTVPGWSALFPWKEGIHDTTVAVAMALLLFLIPVRPPGERTRRPLLEWREAAETIPWGILLLFGGGFALAAGFRETHLDAWMGDQLVHLTGAPTFSLVLSTTLLMTFLTEVTSNTATTTLLLPVLASAAQAAHLHPLLLMLPATLAASCAFMLPVATPPNAVVFGTGWLTIGRMARTGFLLNLATALLIAVLVLGLGRPVLHMMPPEAAAPWPVPASETAGPAAAGR